MQIPPMSDRKRVPAAYDTIDMAGIGVKPATRSGPYFRSVWTWAAETMSTTSSQLARTKPPLPRSDLYARAFSGSSTIEAHARTGSPPFRSRAARNRSRRTPRTYGYRTLIGEYRYQLNEAPRGQPRGSYSGTSGPFEG